MAAYRSGGLRTASALLSSASPESFVDRVATLEVIARRQDAQLRDLGQARRQLADAKSAIDAEVAKQQQQLALMAKKKQEAEQALADAAARSRPSGPSGGGPANAGPTGGGSATAQPAPRRPDGSWPPESCSVNDPTTSGCITPRMLHALQQAKAAGFTRYVSCYRSGSFGEHPKGRACDFAAALNGFGGVATGDERTYGNNLAAYFIRNADALAVLYVIWFKQIWLPSSGWRAYSGVCGDPSCDHTNHVHLSVY
jgi:peptidoglycan DL-endopeptidase CwlO